MDFLLDALNEIAAEVFASVAHLLNLDVDRVFVDTTSTYWQVDVPDELADALREDPVDAADAGEASSPTESGARVIAMAVTRDGIPIRCWTFAGNQADTAIIRRGSRTT